VLPYFLRRLPEDAAAAHAPWRRGGAWTHGRRRCRSVDVGSNRLYAPSPTRQGAASAPPPHRRLQRRADEARPPASSTLPGNSITNPASTRPPHSVHTKVNPNPLPQANYFISGCIDGMVRIWDVPRCLVVDWADRKEIITAVINHSQSSCPARKKQAAPYIICPFVTIKI